MIAAIIVAIFASVLYAREIARNRRLVATIDSERCAYNTLLNRLEAELATTRHMMVEEQA